MADKLKERLIQPTENNPESSRSHVLILLSLKNNDKTNNIVIGDLAGVENKFTCQANRLVQLHKIYQGEMYNGKYYFDIYGNNYKEMCTIKGLKSIESTARSENR